MIARSSGGEVPLRKPGTRDRLTKGQAEAKLRTLMTDMTAPPVVERVTVSEVADRLIARLEPSGASHRPLRAYKSKLKAQIKPRMGDRPVAGVTRDEVEAFMTALARDGLSAHYAANCLGLAHSVFEFALRNGWAITNPCSYVEAPKRLEADTAIRFFDQSEVEGTAGRGS